MSIPKIVNPDVAKIFNNYTPAMRQKLLTLRTLILTTAAATPGVGPLEETIKWNQISYLTTQSKSGSIIRIDKINSSESKYGIFFHCQTDLISRFRKLYPTVFEFDGNRCLILSLNDTIPSKELTDCIQRTLTYRLNRVKS